MNYYVPLRSAEPKLIATFPKLQRFCCKLASTKPLQLREYHIFFSMAPAISGPNFQILQFFASRDSDQCAGFRLTIITRQKRHRTIHPDEHVR